MSMRERRYERSASLYREQLARYRRLHASLSFRLGLLLRWRGVRSALLGGGAALYECACGAPTLFAHRNVQFKRRRLAVRRESKGAEAWARVESDPGAIAFALECPRCGFRHLIAGQDPLVFGDYDGAYAGAWFELFNPRVWPPSSGRLACRRCASEAAPRVRRFAHEPFAEPAPPPPPDDPLYDDPSGPPLP